MLLEINGHQDLKRAQENENPINEHNFWSFQNLTPKCNLTQVLRPCFSLPASLVTGHVVICQPIVMLSLWFICIHPKHTLRMDLIRHLFLGAWFWASYLACHFRSLTYLIGKMRLFIVSTSIDSIMKIGIYLTVLLMAVMHFLGWRIGLTVSKQKLDIETMYAAESLYTVNLTETLLVRTMGNWD